LRRETIAFASSAYVHATVRWRMLAGEPPLWRSPLNVMKAAFRTFGSFVVFRNWTSSSSFFRVFVSYSPETETWVSVTLTIEYSSGASSNTRTALYWYS
jgi:hypothetical protein